MQQDNYALQQWEATQYDFHIVFQAMGADTDQHICIQ